MTSSSEYIHLLRQQKHDLQRALCGMRAHRHIGHLQLLIDSPHILKSTPLESVVDAMRSDSDLCKSRTSWFRTYKNTLTAGELSEWVEKHVSEIQGKQGATELIVHLIQHGFLCSWSNSTSKVGSENDISVNNGGGSGDDGKNGANLMNNIDANGNGNDVNNKVSIFQQISMKPEDVYQVWTNELTNPWKKTECVLKLPIDIVFERLWHLVGDDRTRTKSYAPNLVVEASNNQYVV